jgi:hypothetical protein
MRVEKVLSKFTDVVYIIYTVSYRFPVNKYGGKRATLWRTFGPCVRIATTGNNPFYSNIHLHSSIDDRRSETKLSHNVAIFDTMVHRRAAIARVLWVIGQESIIKGDNSLSPKRQIEYTCISMSPPGIRHTSITFIRSIHIFAPGGHIYANILNPFFL